MDKEVKEILIELMDSLAPEDMSKETKTKLTKETGLGASTIRSARKRESLTGQTLIRLLLANGVSKEAILNLPRNKPTKVSPTLTAWNRTGLTLTEVERKAYLDFVKWNKARFTPTKKK